MAIKPRVRRYGTRINAGPYYYQVYNTAGVMTTSSSSSSASLVGEVGQMFDINTTDFRERIASGGIVNSPMDKAVTISTELFGSVGVYNSNGSKILYQGPYVGALVQAGLMSPMPIEFSTGRPDLAGLNETALRFKAAIAASKSVASPDTLIGVTIAELQKTVGTVSSVAGGIADAVMSAGKGKPSQAILNLLIGRQSRDRRKSPPKRPPSAPEATKTVSQKWLEVRYGWAPMLYDLEGTLAALRAVHQKRYTARGFARDSGTKVTSGQFTLDAAFAHVVQTQVEEQYEYNARAYVLYTVNPAFLQANKLGALSPLTTAWELVPFSFVVDWFVGVGDWLDAITPRIGVIYLAQGMVIESTYNKKVSIIGTTSGSGSSISGAVGLNTNYTTRKKSREIGLALPTLPLINVKLDVKRALDAIALLATAKR